MFARLAQHRLRVPAVGVSGPDRRPARGVADVREPPAIGREAGLADRDRLAAGDDLRRAVRRRARRCATRPTACRGDPTRATRAACRRATTPDPTRSRRATPAPATRCRRSARSRCRTRRRVRARTRPRPGSTRRAPRPGRRTRAPARCRRRRATTTSRPSARGDDELVVGRPRIAAADADVGGHDDRRRAPVGGGDDEIGAAVLGRDPGQPAARGRPPGVGDRTGAGNHRRRDHARNASPAGFLTVCPFARTVPVPPLGLLREFGFAILGPSCLEPAPPTSPRPKHLSPGDPLRIAFLIYRGNPHCGGQGVYSRHLTRELTELGHTVTMFAGQPWPVADAPVTLEQVGGLDLYKQQNPFRVPWPYEFRDAVDLQEFGIMCTAGYPEPYAFSRRVYERLAQPPRRVRPRPRQPVPRHRPARLRARRLAVRQHAAPPDHRRPRPRARPRHESVAPADAAPLVRLLEHADAGRASAAAPPHGVGQLAQGHHRPDGCRRRHAAHRARSASTRCSSGRCRTCSASPAA